MRTALSIAGSDPTGGAGLQADLQVFRHFDLHGYGVITALTVQDSRGVRSVHPVFPSVVLDQLRVLLDDIQPHSVKIGMLATDDVVRNVALGLDRLGADAPVVLDPVLAASDNTILLERRAWPALRELIARTTLVTPNLAEARALTETDVSTAGGIESAARLLVAEIGAAGALLKGGHRDGPPNDLLALRCDGASTVALHWFEGERLPVGPVHGTGCALASAITACLAHGDPLLEAVQRGREFVAKALSKVESRGGGASFLVYP